MHIDQIKKPVSINEQNTPESRKFKIYVQNVHDTRAQTTTPLRNRCSDDGVINHPPLPQQTFFQLFHFMDPRTADPVLKDNREAVVHRIQTRRIGWPHLWGMNSGVSLCSNVTVSRA